MCAARIFFDELVGFLALSKIQCFPLFLFFLFLSLDWAARLAFGFRLRGIMKLFVLRPLMTQLKKMRHRWLLHIVPDQCGQYRIDINTTPIVLTLIPHPFIKTRAINSKIHWLLRIPIFERSCCVAGCDATVYPFIGARPIQSIAKFFVSCALQSFM